MAIELITPELARINGRLVELADRRVPDVFDVLSREDNAALQLAYARPISDVDIRWGQSRSSNIDHELVAYQQIPRLVALAERAAKELAVSWRGFLVGAAAYAVSTTRPTDAAYLIGANNSPYEGADKKCGEMQIVEKAHEKKLDRVVALAIYGPHDTHDVNEVRTDTLHPCLPCREMMIYDPIFQDDTLVITANSEGVVELMFVPDLLAYHGHPSSGSKGNVVQVSVER